MLPFKRIPMVFVLVLGLLSPDFSHASTQHADPDITGNWQGTFNFAAVGSCKGHNGTWKAVITADAVEWFDSYNNTTVRLPRKGLAFEGGALKWSVAAKTGYVTYLMTFKTTSISSAKMGGTVTGPLCDTLHPWPTGTFEGSNATPKPPAPKPQPAPAQPTAIPQPQPAPKPQPQAPAKPQTETRAEPAASPSEEAVQEAKPEGAVDKELERSALELIAAQSAVRKAKDRLSKYDEGVRERDPARIRSALEEDLKEAAVEHRELWEDLVLSLPGVVSEYGGVSKEIAEALKLEDAARAMTASTGAKLAVNAVDALYKAPVGLLEGWTKIKGKKEKGEPTSNMDLLPIVDGLVTGALAVATAPVGPLGKVMEGGGGFWVTAADVMIKTSLVATSQYRYWNSYNHMNDLEATQELNRQRFEIEIRKAEMKEKQLRAQINRLRALDETQ